MAAVEVFQALRVDEDAGRPVGENGIAFAGHVDLHRVGHPGAASLLDKKAQAIFLGGKVLFLEQVEEVPGGGIGEFDHGEK